MKLSVIVPTYNEAPNIQELIRRTTEACSGIEAEIIFVDDSSDSTPVIIQHAAAGSAFPVRMIHRDQPLGGLSGAVIEGITASNADYCLVMDGDLQHPPEMIPVLLAELEDSAGDIVIASR
ncbi:glycosyltransferase involved in cell wall biosynthesis [Arthrobacter sp. CAN_A214]|uniref:glycosyltransferase n=1 Tax=Arthrobacter sp. CAN_A214 TaxID=2787720 RepID=UPI001A2AE74A